MSSRLPALVAAGMLAVGLVGLLALRAQQGSVQKTAGKSCQTSMRTIVAAIELYKATEQRPPERLEQLVPRYLDRLPPCPVAKKQTYSSTYQVYGKKYSLFCRGHYHDREDHPSFNSSIGWEP